MLEENEGQLIKLTDGNWNVIQCVDGRDGEAIYVLTREGRRLWCKPQKNGHWVEIEA